MANVVIPYRFRVKRDTAAAFAAANTLLLSGEIGLETDTRRYKIGDGTTAWNSLPYSSAATIADTRRILDLLGSTAEGDIIYKGPSGWTRLAKDADGKILKLASGLPAWANESGGGGEPSSDPHWASVVSMLRFESWHESTTFTDDKGHSWSPTGANIDTSAQKFGAGCCHLASGTRYLDATSSDFTIGGDDFTIEMFVRMASATGTKILFDMRPASTSGVYPTLYISASQLRFLVSSVDRITGGTVPAGNFIHVAVARASGTTRLFLGVQQVGSDYADGNSYLGTRVRLGNGGDEPTSAAVGLIDAYRFTKGVGRYTANFTPPVEAFPDF